MAPGLTRTTANYMFIIESTLLDGAVAATDGVWLSVNGFHPLSFHISGITSATLQIRGSNAPTRPADSEHGFQLGSDIGSDSLTALDAPVKWIKARISSYVSGTIYCYMIGSTNAG